MNHSVASDTFWIFFQYSFSEFDDVTFVKIKRTCHWLAMLCRDIEGKHFLNRLDRHMRLYAPGFWSDARDCLDGVITQFSYNDEVPFDEVVIETSKKELEFLTNQSSKWLMTDGEKLDKHIYTYDIPGMVKSIIIRTGVHNLHPRLIRGKHEIIAHISADTEEKFNNALALISTHRDCVGTVWARNIICNKINTPFCAVKAVIHYITLEMGGHDKIPMRYLYSYFDDM